MEIITKRKYSPIEKIIVELTEIEARHLVGVFSCVKYENRGTVYLLGHSDHEDLLIRDFIRKLENALKSISLP